MPSPGRHVELTAAPLPQLGNRRDRPLKGLGVERHAVADPAKVRQIEGHRPEPRNSSRRRRPPENREAVDDALLPHEHSCEAYDPDYRE
ncbi:hypothetical protein U1Q18_036858 [Sarracenia purpurea var. burkii]